MTPIILSEKIGTTASADLSAVPLPFDEAMPLFSDMLLLDDLKTKVAAKVVAAAAIDGHAMYSASDDTIVPSMSDALETKDVVGEPLILAAQPNASPPMREVASQSLLEGPRQVIGGALNDLSRGIADSKVGVADQKISTDAKTLFTHQSVARSAIESLLPPPSAARAIMKQQDIHSTLLQTPTANLVVGGNTAEIAASGANVAQPQVKLPHSAESTAKTALIEHRSTRDFRDDRAAMPETKVATPTQHGQVPLHPSTPPAVALAKTLVASTPEIPGSAIKLPDAELTLGINNGERNFAVLSAPGQAAPAVGADTARQIATQIAVSVGNHPAKTTEIALNPEELGRVRLSMTAVDGTLTLHVVSERPETQDLLRRHIEILAQEFRELGYDQISFSFGEGGQTHADQGAALDAEHTFSDTGENQPMQSEPDAAPSSGLDLRL